MNRLELLKEWQSTLQESDRVLESLDKAIGVNDGPLRNNIYTMQCRYTRALSMAIGDSGEWLDWYAFENDFGRKGLKASLSLETKRGEVKTLKQLLKLIDESNKQ